MNTKPPTPPPRPPVSLAVKANRLRGAAAVPYRTAKSRRVMKMSKP